MKSLKFVFGALSISAIYIGCESGEPWSPTDANVDQIEATALSSSSTSPTDSLSSADASTSSTSNTSSGTPLSSQGSSSSQSSTETLSSSNLSSAKLSSSSSSSSSIPSTFKISFKDNDGSGCTVTYNGKSINNLSAESFANGTPVNFKATNCNKTILSWTGGSPANLAEEYTYTSNNGTNGNISLSSKIPGFTLNDPNSSGCTFSVNNKTFNAGAKVDLANGTEFTIKASGCSKNKFTWSPKPNTSNNDSTEASFKQDNKENTITLHSEIIYTCATAPKWEDQKCNDPSQGGCQAGLVVLYSGYLWKLNTWIDQNTTPSETATMWGAKLWTKGAACTSPSPRRPIKSKL